MYKKNCWEILSHQGKRPNRYTYTNGHRLMLRDSRKVGYRAYSRVFGFRES